MAYPTHRLHSRFEFGRYRPVCYRTARVAAGRAPCAGRSGAWLPTAGNSKPMPEPTKKRRLNVVFDLSAKFSNLPAVDGSFA